MPLLAVRTLPVDDMSIRQWVSLSRIIPRLTIFIWGEVKELKRNAGNAFNPNCIHFEKKEKCNILTSAAVKLRISLS